MSMGLKFDCSDVGAWNLALSSYESLIESLNKPNLVSLDQFYRQKLPSLLHERDPNPYITTSELSELMKWKLTRGKWRPRLLNFVSCLDESSVESASGKAFESLPDISKAVNELTVLKGIGPATASAVLAAYAPETAPFMSDEAMEAVLGTSKDYSLKQYLLFANKIQAKAKLIGYLDWWLGRERESMNGLGHGGSHNFGTGHGGGFQHTSKGCGRGAMVRTNGTKTTYTNPTTTRFIIEANRVGFSGVNEDQ